MRFLLHYVAGSAVVMVLFVRTGASIRRAHRAAFDR
jgi:hypothetical protein